MDTPIAMGLSDWFENNSGLVLPIFLGALFLFQLWQSFRNKAGFYAWYLFVVVTTLSIALYQDAMHYFWTFLLGMLTAFGEIINKFKDEPIKALPTPYALFYLIVNGAIAVGALKVCILINNNQMPTEPLEQLKWVLLAGLGSMLIMRSKFFDVKVGDKEIAFGPEQIINIYLEYLVTSIDRYRALNRIDFVKRYLGNINFEIAVEECKAMLASAPQALAKDRLDDWTGRIEVIKQSGYKGELLSYKLGFVLLDAMGEGFVDKIFATVPPEWRMRAPIPEPIPASIPEGGKIERLYRFLSSESRTIPYLAYGRSMASSSFRERLGWSGMTDADFKRFTRPRNCELEGYRLVFNKSEPPKDPQSGRANLVPDTNGRVRGVLYDLSQEALEFLDREEKGYKRISVDVKTGAGKVKAEALVAEVTCEGLKPTQQYLDLLVAGAKEHGIDHKYIQDLEARGASSVADGGKSVAIKDSSEQTGAPLTAQGEKGSSGVDRRLPLDTQTETVEFFSYGEAMSTTVFHERYTLLAMEMSDFLAHTRPRKGALQGFRLEFNKLSETDASGEGEANIVEDKEGTVRGVLYTIAAEWLKFICKAEPQQRLVAVNVNSEGKSVIAKTLVAKSTQEGLSPKHEQVAQMIQSAKEHRFDEDYIKNLEQFQVPAKV